jgi:molecular chaperone DnaK
MTKEAERFADEDRRHRQEVEVRNQADYLVYSSRKTLNDLKGKVDNAKIEAAEKALSELEQLLKENKMDQVEAKMREVSELLGRVGEEAYKQAGPQTPPPGGEGPSGGGPDEGKTVEGDFEVKK